MTDTSTAAVAAILEGVTPGPWVVYAEPEVGLPPSLFAGKIGTFDFGPVEPLRRRDLQFVAWCRQGVPALVAERDAERARAETAEEAHVFADAALAAECEKVARLTEALERIESISVRSCNGANGVTAQHWQTAFEAARDEAALAIAALEDRTHG